MQEVRECIRCGRNNCIEKHHIFGGSNRKKSEKYGLTVDLCHWCHNEPPIGAHHNAAIMLKLHQEGQKKAMKENNWTTEDFIREFGKNYL